MPCGFYTVTSATSLQDFSKVGVVGKQQAASFHPPIRPGISNYSWWPQFGPDLSEAKQIISKLVPFFVV